MQRTALERSVAVFGVNCASAVAAPVAAAMSMARPPLAPARLRAPGGYVATRERSVPIFELRSPTCRLWRVYIRARAHKCIDTIMLAISTPTQTHSTLSRSASIHASPAVTNAAIVRAPAVGNAPNAAQPSTQTAPLHQQPHPHPCSSDRCLICLTRPDDYEDVSRGMTCGMCSACGTFFCGSERCPHFTPSTRKTSQNAGECKPQLARRACAADADRALKERGWGACPACRAPLRASHSENVKRLERLLITRTEGKHVARVQYKLGLAYELGRGVIRDDAKASKLYEAAARGGHVKAMFAYAISLDEGRGLSRDPSKAVEWFQHAASKGSAKAQFSLGIRFAEGRGVSRDPGRALHWFEKARKRRPCSLRPSCGSRDDEASRRWRLGREVSFRR